jgi:hypothetical protein
LHADVEGDVRAGSVADEKTLDAVNAAVAEDEVAAGEVVGDESQEVGRGGGG